MATQKHIQKIKKIIETSQFFRALSQRPVQLRWREDEKEIYGLCFRLPSVVDANEWIKQYDESRRTSLGITAITGQANNTEFKHGFKGDLREHLLAQGLKIEPCDVGNEYIEGFNTNEIMIDFRMIGPFKAQALIAILDKQLETNSIMQAILRQAPTLTPPVQPAVSQVMRLGPRNRKGLDHASNHVVMPDSASADEDRFPPR